MEPRTMSVADDGVADKRAAEDGRRLLRRCQKRGHRKWALPTMGPHIMNVGTDDVADDATTDDGYCQEQSRGWWGHGQ